MEAVLPQAAAATAAADLRNLGWRSLNDGVRSHAGIGDILGWKLMEVYSNLLCGQTVCLRSTWVND